MNSSFAHNLFYCCHHFNEPFRNLWHLTSAYILQLYTDSVDVYTYWWRGSVVRTSVCSWRTFPDLRLIHGWRDHFVGKAFAMGQPTRPAQPPALSGTGW